MRQEQDVPPRSAGYVSPEQILSYQLTDYDASWVPCNPFACDIFSLAAIMANLMLGVEADVVMPSSQTMTYVAGFDASMESTTPS